MEENCHAYEIEILESDWEKTPACVISDAHPNQSHEHDVLVEAFSSIGKQASNWNYAKGEIIGTICSFNKQPRQFTNEELRIVELFARAAIALDNHRLYHQMLARRSPYPAGLRPSPQAKL